MAKRAKAFTFELEQQDAAFAEAAEAVASTMKVDPFLSLDEVVKSTAGLQLPCLALEYIFGANIWPFGRSCEVYGEPHSAKSAFVVEAMRWHLRAGGYGALIENEGKDASSLVKGMYSVREQRRARQHPTNSVESWQGAVSFWTNFMDAKMPRGDTGRKDSKQKAITRPMFFTPMCIVLDSLTSTTTDSLIEKMDDAGHATRGFAEEALLISKFLKTMPDKLRGRPYSFIFTNHFKPSVGSNGVPKENVPGGFAGKYLATHRLFLDRAYQGKEDNSDGSGSRVIRMKATKSCLGPEGRWIDATLKWFPARNEDGERTGDQTIFWDWDEATIKFLLAFKEKKKATFNDIMDVVDLHDKSRRVWSKTLGIEKDHPVTFSEAGAILESNPIIVQQLRNVLMIATHGVFVGNTQVEYGAFVDACIAGASEEEKLAAAQPRPYAPEVDLSGAEDVEEEVQAPSRNIGRLAND